MVNLFNAEHSQVRADPTRLRQVMWNLINNARKFSRRLALRGFERHFVKPLDVKKLLALLKS